MDHFIDTKQANPTKKQAKLRYTKRLTYANPKNRLRDKNADPEKKGQLSALYKTAIDNDFLIKTLPPSKASCSLWAMTWKMRPLSAATSVDLSL